MEKLIYCEFIKNKHTFAQKLIWIAPVATILLAFLMGGTSNLEPMSFYWWYSFILCSFVGILCGLSIQREKRAGKFYSVYSQPISLSGFWQAKAVSLSVLILVSNLVLAVLMVLIAMGNVAPHAISPVRMVLGAVCIAISSLWQIPLCLWMADKAGMFLPVLVNAIAGLVSTFVSSSTYWWTYPYAWTTKIVEPVMGIKSSGEMGVLTDFDAILIPIILCVSIALFLLMTFLTSQWFVRQEVK